MIQEGPSDSVQHHEAWAVTRVQVESKRFPAHSHDEFVVSVNAPTVLRERVRLGRDRFDVGSTEVTAYNPGEVQSSVTETIDNVPWQLLSLHLTLRQVRELTGLDHVELTRPVLAGGRLARGLRRAAEATDPMLASEWAKWVVSATVAAVGEQSKRVSSGSIELRLARKAGAFMRTDLTRPVRLDEVAAYCGASPDALARAFVAEFGVPPYAWHLHERLRQGHRRLAGGVCPIDVASELGFADQSHFHRHFVAAYARTPADLVRITR